MAKFHVWLLEVGHLELWLLELWWLELSPLSWLLLVVVWLEKTLHHVTDWIGSLMVGWLIVVVWLDHLNKFLVGFLHPLSKSLKCQNEVWEHQLQWVLILVLLEGILDLCVECSFLHMFSLDSLIPLKVKSSEGGHYLSHIIRESIDFTHDLHIRVASVINGEKLHEVREFSNELEEVVEESLLKTLKEDALSWVLNTP